MAKEQQKKRYSEIGRRANKEFVERKNQARWMSPGLTLIKSECRVGAAYLNHMYGRRGAEIHAEGFSMGTMSFITSVPAAVAIALAWDLSLPEPGDWSLMACVIR